MGLCLVLVVWCCECNSKFCFTLFVFLLSCGCVYRESLSRGTVVFPGRTHLSERVVKNRKIIVSLPSIGSLLSYSVYRNLFRKVHLQAFSDDDRHGAIHFGVVSKAKRENSIACHAL